MENAYNICHSLQDLLHFRGFFWEGAGGKGKGCKKKGKKGLIFKNLGFNVLDIWLCGNLEISIGQSMATLLH